MIENFKEAFEFIKYVITEIIPMIFEYSITTKIVITVIFAGAGYIAFIITIGIIKFLIEKIIDFINWIKRKLANYADRK